MIRTAALFLSLVLIAGCYERNCHATLIHTNVNEANELWGRVDDGDPIILLRQAQAYRPLLSPDGNWLAVEVRQMSDLHVVRLFRHDGERLVATDIDVTAHAWQLAAAGSNITPGELTHPRTHIFAWDSEAQTLSLALSATTPGIEQPFEMIITIQLDQEPWRVDNR